MVNFIMGKLFARNEGNSVSALQIVPPKDAFKNFTISFREQECSSNDDCVDGGVCTSQLDLKAGTRYANYKAAAGDEKKHCFCQSGRGCHGEQYFQKRKDFISVF